MLLLKTHTRKKPPSVHEMGGGRSGFLFSSLLEEFRWKFDFLAGADAAFRLLSTLQEVPAVKQLLPLPFESGELNSERLWKETRRAWGLRRQPPYRRRFFTPYPQTDRFHSSATIGRRADSGAGETSGMKQQETLCSLKQAAG